MLEELELDLKNGSLYFSKRFTPAGDRVWPDLLRDAIQSGDDTTLATALKAPGLFVRKEIVHSNGKPYQKTVPYDANVSLAESEFSRFYLRALSRRASEDGKRLTVYRAKLIDILTSASFAMIGAAVDPVLLLADLRTSIGLEAALGLRPGVDSGLSAHLPGSATA